MFFINHWLKPECTTCHHIIIVDFMTIFLQKSRVNYQVKIFFKYNKEQQYCSGHNCAVNRVDSYSEDGQSLHSFQKNNRVFLTQEFIFCET